MRECDVRNLEFSPCGFKKEQDDCITVALVHINLERFVYDLS